MKKGKAQWILGNKNSSKGVKIMRWVARIWSLSVLAFALGVVFTPDPYHERMIPVKDIFMLSLWGVAILGLVLAWRWERLGALVTIITMPLRELIYPLLFKGWNINFLLVWVLIIPPAVMYLLGWWLDRKGKI